jgi:predicted flap endonuclease-1-like 5' DNA nuclease
MHMYQTEHEHEIRTRAHAIWEDEGHPDGHHLIHWQRAMLEVIAMKAGIAAAHSDIDTSNEGMEATDIAAKAAAQDDEDEASDETAEQDEEDELDEDKNEDELDEEEDGEDDEEENDDDPQATAANLTDGQTDHAKATSHAAADLGGLDTAKPITDVSLIDGIGPKITAQLEEIGITTLFQVSDLSDEEMAEIDASLGLRGRSVREEWITQAKELMSGQAPRAKTDQDRLATV